MYTVGGQGGGCQVCNEEGDGDVGGGRRVVTAKKMVLTPAHLPLPSSK